MRIDKLLQLIKEGERSFNNGSTGTRYIHSIMDNQFICYTTYPKSKNVKCVRIFDFAKWAASKGIAKRSKLSERN